MFSQSFKENLREYVAIRQHSQSFLTESNIMKFSSQRVVTDRNRIHVVIYLASMQNLLSFNRIPYTKYCVQRKQKRSQCVHSVYNLKILKKNSYFRYNKKNRFKRLVYLPLPKVSINLRIQSEKHSYPINIVEVNLSRPIKK